AQPLLLAGGGEKEDRSFRPRRRRREGARDLEDRGDAGGVVERAVVDGIAVDRLADAEVIEVRGVDDLLVSQLLIGAAQDAGDVRALHGLVPAGDVNGGVVREL